MRKCLIALLVMCFGVFAQDIQLVYMGIIPGGAPSFEKQFDKNIREQISVISGVEVADFDVTENLKRKTDFQNSPEVTRSFIEKLMMVSTGKTLVVWGKITHFNIKPVRRLLLGVEAVGTLTLSLTMYSTDFREYAYLGDVTCEARIPKPPVWFRNVEKVTHITAADRSTLSQKLQQETAGKSADIISGVIRNQLVKSGDLRMDEVKVKKVPSVSDLFDIPTVEAPDIGESGPVEIPQPEESEPETIETGEAAESEETEKEKPEEE